MDLDILLNQQRPLRLIETALKKIYQKYPERNLQAPHPLNSLTDIFDELSQLTDSDIITKMTAQILSEDSFFSNGSDTELYRHFRYLPAYWHSHSFIEIVCVFDGNCINYINNQEISMQPGDVCIIAPNTQHCISAFSDDCIIFNVELRTSTFETAFFGVLNKNDILADFFTHILYKSPKHSHIFFRTNRDRELFDYILYAYQEFIGNRRYKQRMINNVIMAFFTILLRNHETEVLLPDTEQKEKSEDIIFLLQYIQTNYNTVTLSELAAFFNYSERQLQRILKKNTGSSFRTIILKLKMQQAAELLLTSDLPVSAISESLGYSDTGNFRQVFKNHFGITPIEYRNQKKFHHEP